MHVSTILLVAIVAWWTYSWIPSGVTWYQITTSIKSLKEVAALPQEEVEKCMDAFDNMVKGVATDVATPTDTEVEYIRRYYRVLHGLLAAADIEKMYIPPQIDESLGLFGNQDLWEKHVAKGLGAAGMSETGHPLGKGKRLLEPGCGRGRIAWHMTQLTGAKVYGFNIDDSQIENAIEYAKETGLDKQLDFKVSDYHKRFPYEDNFFDGGYEFEAMWGFIKQSELDFVASEMFRVLKPGARFFAADYVLTPIFNRSNPVHARLRDVYMPTLAGTQSSYETEIRGALEKAGFETVLSIPSVAPAWPITNQKRDLFLTVRKIVVGLAKIRLVGPWVEKFLTNLMSGGVAWNTAEKSKLSDMNWQLIVRKPAS